MTAHRIAGIEITNPGRVVYPNHQFTKPDVVEYYTRVARFMLPHLKDRPVTLKRYPDTTVGPVFYEKDAPEFTPSWVKTVPVARRTGEGVQHGVFPSGVLDVGTYELIEGNLAGDYVHVYFNGLKLKGDLYLPRDKAAESAWTASRAFLPARHRHRLAPATGQPRYPEPNRSLAGQPEARRVRFR